MTESGMPRADLELTGDERLLAGLLAGETVTEAAANAGMHERTARRRVADEEFRRRLDDGRREFDSVLAAQLASDAELGRAVLRQLAADETCPPSVRANAAWRLLSSNAEYGPQRDYGARLEEIEKRLGVDPRTGWKAAAA
jgi:hypothetical protein